MKLHKIAIVSLAAPLTLFALTGCGEDDKKKAATEGEGEAVAAGEGEGEGEEPAENAENAENAEGAGEGEGEMVPAGEGEGEMVGPMGEGEGEGEMMGPMGEGEGEGEPPNPCVPGDLAATGANSPFAAAIDADNGVAVADWVDRVGNPGINTALIKAIFGDDAATAYNQSGVADWSKWGDEFGHVIWAYGCIDGVEGGVIDGLGLGLNAGVVGGLLAKDVLLIDTAHTYDKNAYLGYVDAGVVGGALGLNAPGGGRTLGEDVIKFTILALTGVDAYPAVPQDGVFPVDVDGDPMWPYLAPSH